MLEAKLFQFADHLDTKGQPFDVSNKLLNPAETPKDGKNQLITSSYTPAQ